MLEGTGDTLLTATLLVLVLLAFAYSFWAGLIVLMALVAYVMVRANN